MEPLAQILKGKRSWRQQVTLYRQRLYLWRRFKESRYRDGSITKRKLAKALRNRLAEMSKAEGVTHRCYRNPKQSILRNEKLVRHNRRERLMIHSILTDMYSRFIGPDHLGTE